MMPIIRPLTIQSDPMTEYQKERAEVARLQVELRRRKRVHAALWRIVSPWARALSRGLSRFPAHADRKAFSGSAKGDEAKRALEPLPRFDQPKVQ